ncbi:MAG: hypothetical protein WC474_07565 [Hydrogenophilaceae bacterium]
MPAVKLLATLLLLIPLPLHAQDIDLGALVASGKWAMAYQRVGELKPLHYKKTETGTSYTCIAGNARDKIVDWIASKGCTIEKEAMVKGVYRLDGQCRLKWWKSRPIPVSVELKPQSNRRFSLNIQTRDNGLLGFTEKTSATLVGPCDPPSAGQPEQHQGTKT